MLKNPDEINLGYGEPYRNFIFVDDMMSVWQTVIQNYNKCNNGKIFTIGPNNPVKIKDYTNMIAKKVGRNGRINWDTKPKRPGEIFWLNSNSNLIEKTLGWTHKVSLNDGLDYTVDVWKNKLKNNFKL